MSDAKPDHLSTTTTDRGFDHLPSIPSTYGGKVRVFESSAALGPHIWLNVTCPADLNQPDGPSVEAVAHLTAEHAWQLADQLRHLVVNHYQGSARPDRSAQ